MKDVYAIIAYCLIPFVLALGYILGSYINWLFGGVMAFFFFYVYIKSLKWVDQK